MLPGPKMPKAAHTGEYNAYGKYKIRMYDGIKKQWRTIVIDDWVPVSRANGQAIFAKPNGDEAWVLLLEKV
jgi:calpain-15